MTLSPRPVVRTLALTLCTLTLSFPALAEGSRSKLDRALRGAPRHGSQRVIIQTRPGSRAVLKRTLQQHGDVVQAEHPGLDALTVLVHGQDLAELERNPAVLSVSLDAEVTAFGGPARRRPGRPNRQAAAQLLRDALGLNGLPFSGAGVNVAVMDSGIEPTADLRGRIAGFWDFTRDGMARHPFDDYGHGTHVSGLIASSGTGSNFEFAGVAPGVKLYGFKVLDKNGRGRTSHVVNAIEFIVRSRESTAHNAVRIDVLNLSLGHPIYEPAASDPLVRAVEKAVRAGIVVVTAAGNLGEASKGDTGYAGIMSPGNAPSAVTVGAADNRHTQRVSDDRVAGFSSRGPTWFDGLAKPDLVAPGVALTSDAPRFSALFTRYPELKTRAANGHGSYGRLSGTSMASAVATGVAALVIQASRTANESGASLTPNATKAVLQYTAVPLRDAAGRSYDALTQGTGGINARGAVTMALAIDTGVPEGAPWLRFSPEPHTPLAGGLVSWSRAVLWDDQMVRGTDALAFNSPQWSGNSAWGAALGPDDGVWGTAAESDNIVWGTSQTWAADLVWADRVVGLMEPDENIVWGTTSGLDGENIVWGTRDGDNIVWGTWNGENIVWGTSDGDNIVWGTSHGSDNIVWGTSGGSDNIVWGTAAKDR